MSGIQVGEGGNGRVESRFSICGHTAELIVHERSVQVITAVIAQHIFVQRYRALARDHAELVAVEEVCPAYITRQCSVLESHGEL